MSSNEEPLKDKTRPEDGSPAKAVVHSVATVRNKKKLLQQALIALVAVLVIVLCFIWYKHVHDRRVVVASEQACITGSNETTLKQAYKAIAAPNVVTQKQLITKLQMIPNYQKDPDCLYPIVMYYINVDDPQAASTNLNLLANVYNPKKGYGYFPGYPIESIATLKQDVATLQLNVKQSKNNVETFSNSP
jgi:hypothetical protein